MGESGKTEGPFDRLRAAEIQREQKKKEEAEREESSKRSSVVLFVLGIFKGFWDLFEKEKRKPFVGAKIPLLELKELLEILKKEDRSEDPQFFQQMALCWGKVLEEAILVSKDSPARMNLDSLIQELEMLSPEPEERSLGYYLLEYSGKSWLPFPYMELIRRLHEEHRKNPVNSLLSRWTQMIDHLIVRFNV